MHIEIMEDKTQTIVSLRAVGSDGDRPAAAGIEGPSREQIEIVEVKSRKSNVERKTNPLAGSGANRYS